MLNDPRIWGTHLKRREVVMLFQPQTEPEEATNPPPTKRLRSEAFLRVLVALPDGVRHQLDVSRECTLKVGNEETLKKCSFQCLSCTDVCTRPHTYNLGFLQHHLTKFVASFKLSLECWNVVKFKINLALSQGSCPFNYMSPWSHLYATIIVMMLCSVKMHVRNVSPENRLMYFNKTLL